LRDVQRASGIYGIKVRICHRINVPYRPRLHCFASSAQADRIRRGTPYPPDASAVSPRIFVQTHKLTRFHHSRLQPRLPRAPAVALGSPAFMVPSLVRSSLPRSLKEKNRQGQVSSLHGERYITTRIASVIPLTQSRNVCRRRTRAIRREANLGTRSKNFYDLKNF
jgi:hypothetical protein